MHHRQAMLVQQNAKARAVSVLDPEHQLSVDIESRHGSTHNSLNPFRDPEVALNTGNKYAGDYPCRYLIPLSTSVPSIVGPPPAASLRHATFDAFDPRSASPPRAGGPNQPLRSWF